MKKHLNITVLMDSACIPDEDPDFTGDAGDESTEHHVVNALRALEHEVSVLGVGESVGEFVNALLEKKPDMVFNLTEEFRGNRLMDRNIVAILEMAGIPFTGTGPTGLMLCRHKGLCKQLLSPHGIHVPAFFVFPPRCAIHVPRKLKYPMVIKPAYGDGSDGISNASLVRDESALKERVQMIHERWKQPAIAEEYIEGRELYVSVIGNSRLQVLPPRELFFKKKEETGEGPVLATYKVKWDEEYQKKWGIKFGFAELEEPILKKISRACSKVYRTLQINDYGRLDLRLTQDNRIVILEANANPDIAYGEELAEAAEKTGIKYNQLINRVLQSAHRRYAVPYVCG